MGGIIRLKNAVKEFCDGKDKKIRALDIDELEIGKGEFTVILGRSGSGKSTLLNVIGAQCDLTSGDVYFDDKEYKSLKDSEKALLRARKFGYVFQSYSLIPQYTVFQNIELALIIAKSKLSVKDQKNRIKECAKLVGIDGLLRKRAVNLSGGEKQRCAIARAIVNDPEVILADEPTGALDVKTGEEVLDLFRELNKAGKTVIIVTHNTAFAEYADRIIELSDGKIIKNEKALTTA